MVGVTGSGPLRGAQGPVRAVPRMSAPRDARGALPAAPTGASSAPPPPAPSHPRPGRPHKGDGEARRALEGPRARDEVAGPLRPPRPRLCLPGSAPPAEEPHRPRRPHPSRYPGFQLASSGNSPRCLTQQIQAEPSPVKGHILSVIGLTASHWCLGSFSLRLGFFPFPKPSSKKPTYPLPDCSRIRECGGIYKKNFCQSQP
ncbi:actin nucleation-promoting factor WASL-like isoform X2 [Equus przewalskii]|uniref:Actin nucleation-promoting factor WASL-like isoform X2 n=1 Tax=Equus przewalskii TaxID=9798 RepID=A0ABM4KZ89_EQUPR